MQLTVDIIGWIAAACILAAYALVSTGKVKAASYSYQGLNLFGGVGLAANTAYYTSYPSTALNLVWAVIAVYAIWQLVNARREMASP